MYMYMLLHVYVYYNYMLYKMYRTKQNYPKSINMRLTLIINKKREEENKLL